MNLTAKEIELAAFKLELSRIVFNSVGNVPLEQLLEALNDQCEEIRGSIMTRDLRKTENEHNDGWQ